jgi:lysophospholipase L1-like esterase
LSNEYPNASANAAAAALSATNAATSATNAATSATTASNAQTAAELARDAANATGKIYPTSTSGLAGTTSGQYFNVVSAGANDYLDLYLNNAGVAVYQKTYPSTAYLRNSVGKLNFWPDPFFRRFDLTSETFLGRDRWWTSVSGSVFTGWSRVANTVFDGYALRRAADQGTTPVNNLALWLDEIGATTGDTVTVYALFVGESGVDIRLPARFDTGSDRSYVGSQLSAVNATGGINLTGSSTPQWLKITTTVPATAQRLAIYPYTPTGGKTFDVVAVWGGKGSNITDWPMDDDVEYLRKRMPDLDTAITNNTNQQAELDYIALSISSPTYSASSVSLAVTSATAGSAYGDPFSGWGERYTPEEVSFNAIKVKFIGRNESLITESTKWRTINVVIRTGVNSHSAGATVVAVGSALVNPDSDSLTDITILLRDPTTNALKTLTNADFSGDEYFVGIYARNTSNAVASMSPHRGTQSNSLGHSYYVTGLDPKTSTWLNYSENLRLGVEHLLLTSPVDSVVYEPTANFVEKLLASQAVTAPTIVIPPKLHILQGCEVSMYWDNIILDDASDYNFDITNATTGSHQSERYTTNPSGAVSAHLATISVYDKKQSILLTSQTINVQGVASSANSGTTKKVLMIGDSLTQDGIITQTLLDIAATDVMGITLLGTRGSGSNKHEGRGGWKVSDYSTVGRTFYSFTVSGITTTPQINSTEYTNNGSTFKVQETSITAGAGTIICERVSGTNAPTASGILTKSNAGVGDSSISFSASSTVSGNPFWIGGALNFAQYLANNAIATPDFVVIMLGTNDVFGQTTDASAISTSQTSLTNLDALIDSIKAADANTKVALIAPPCPSFSQDAFATSYGVDQTRWRFKRNALLFAKQLYSRYTGIESSRVYICAASTNLDTVNNMQTASSAPINSRSSVNVTRQNNGVHPASSGYRQIADGIWAFLKNV